jgi:hypothetical protein
MQLGVALLRRPVDLDAAGIAELRAVAEAVIGVTRVEPTWVDDVGAAVGRPRFDIMSTVAVGTQVPCAPRTDPAVRLSRSGLLSQVTTRRHSGLGRPIQSGTCRNEAASLGNRHCVRHGWAPSGSPRPHAFPPPSPPPTPPALFESFNGTTHTSDVSCPCIAGVRSSELPSAARCRGRSKRASMRPPRFRRVLFARSGVLDHGRASAPRVAAPHMLPSTGQTVSASATLTLSRLNSPLRTIAVYASPVPSPARTQHSLPGGRYPLPGPVLHRLERASFSCRTRPQFSPIFALS